jgi:hypothetical protein
MSISRDMMYALGAVALAVIGGGILRFSRNSTSRVHVLLRVIARGLVLLGFFLIGTVFWWYVSRPPRSFLPGWVSGQRTWRGVGLSRN